MTVQRQYILPNCNLVVEGLIAGDESDPSSPMTVLLNSECTFPGTSNRLSGGREFLDALVNTVSTYAQFLLSGVSYPSHEAASATQAVTLKHTDGDRHRLVATVAEPNGEKQPKSIELNSVQLFDLVEAVDQLLADTLTLPDLTLQVAPLNRRHARLTEPPTKRVIPAAVGVSTLAAAAVLLFMPPIPEFEPTRVEQTALSDLVEQEAANLDESGDSPDEPEAATEGEESDAPEPEEDDAIASESDDEDEEEPPTESESQADADAVDPVTAGIALGRLSSAPVIDDDRTLNDIEAELESNLRSALEELLDGAEPDFSRELIYRVAVSEDVEILGYKYENDAALENIDNTPLPGLTFIAVDTDEASDEPIAQFLITFDPDGEVNAEPIDPEDDEE